MMKITPATTTRDSSVLERVRRQTHWVDYALAVRREKASAIKEAGIEPMKALLQVSKMPRY